MLFVEQKTNTETTHDREGVLARSSTSQHCNYCVCEIDELAQRALQAVLMQNHTGFLTVLDDDEWDSHCTRALVAL